MQHSKDKCRKLNLAPRTWGCCTCLCASHTSVAECLGKLEIEVHAFCRDGNSSPPQDAGDDEPAVPETSKSKGREIVWKGAPSKEDSRGRDKRPSERESGRDRGTDR